MPFTAGWLLHQRNTKPWTNVNWVAKSIWECSKTILDSYDYMGAKHGVQIGYLNMFIPFTFPLHLMHLVAYLCKHIVPYFDAIQQLILSWPAPQWQHHPTVRQKQWVTVEQEQYRHLAAWVMEWMGQRDAGGDVTCCRNSFSLILAPAWQLLHWKCTGKWPPVLSLIVSGDNFQCKNP